MTNRSSSHRWVYFFIQNGFAANASILSYFKGSWGWERHAKQETFVMRTKPLFTVVETGTPHMRQVAYYGVKFSDGSCGLIRREGLRAEIITTGRQEADTMIRFSSEVPQVFNLI